jgi:uroporphyrinogen-III synthase
MPGQSLAPILMLTRPLAQSRRFAQDLRLILPSPPRICISPLFAPAFLPVQFPVALVHALIFSSETGARAYAKQPLRIASMAYCVGNRTAAAAKAAGLDVRSANGDADALVDLILRAKPAGPLLHLRGEDSRGNIASRLTAAGIVTHEAVIYVQRACAMTATAKRLLAGRHPLVVPLFSPRSAALFSATAGTAPLHVIAMSDAVAQAVDSRLQPRMTIAMRPTGDAMLTATLQVLAALSPT